MVVRFITCWRIKNWEVLKLELEIIHYFIQDKTLEEQIRGCLSNHTEFSSGRKWTDLKTCDNTTIHKRLISKPVVYTSQKPTWYETLRKGGGATIEHPVTAMTSSLIWPIESASNSPITGAMPIGEAVSDTFPITKRRNGTGTPFMNQKQFHNNFTFKFTPEAVGTNSWTYNGGKQY